uniref:HTH CENPB-type domain-containing protein n=1 Tax=Latimeria chalumnae TaxID=7897 RepID=H2ZUV2_LATCH
SDIENCLLAWFHQARAQSILVSGPILTEKANQFGAQLGVENFECTNGWLEHFKARHGVSSRLVCGEANSAPQLLINEWKSTTLVAILAQYKLRDTYNADETGLFWQLLLNRTLAFKGEKCSSGKQSKQRFTVLLAANNDGSDSRNTFKLDVLMSIIIMKKAWDLVEKETIANCFCHCGFTREQPAGEDNVLEEESEESSHFNNTVDQLHIIGLWPTNVSQDDFIDVDAVVSVSELTSDSDIVAAQSMIDNPDHDDDDDDDDAE